MNSKVKSVVFEIVRIIVYALLGYFGIPASGLL